MDILDKIDNLRKQRGWSIYKLAEEATLTQSTVANMFARKSLPSINTLKLICEAFNMSLAEFFSENVVVEKTTISSKFQKLSERDKKIVNSLIDLMYNKK